MAFNPGDRIGQYRIEAQLGHGGMATIYKAHHARLARSVAIKVLHPAFTRDQNFLARFQREAQIVAGLEHRHIVPIYDFDEIDGQPYLVLKYIEGETLKAIIERAALPLNEIIRIMTPIADALDYAHGQGVLHRDIKPSNILIERDGTPYLTDFGLARMAHIGDSTVSADVLLGTPNYISPEQALGRKDIDARADVYALGVVLYELVTGRVPFSADTPYAVIHDHIYAELPKPSAINPQIPDAIEAVLVKALAKAPEDRYESAGALVSAFRDAVAASGLEQREPLVKVASPPAAGPQLLKHDQPTALTPAPQPQPAEPQLPEKPKRQREVEASWDFSFENVERALDNLGTQIHDIVGDGIDRLEGKDLDLAPPDDYSAARRRAERSVKNRSEFFAHVASFAAMNLFLWALYFFSSASSGGGFAWPLFVTFGWGAGVAAHAIDVYAQTGRRGIERTRRIHEGLRERYGDGWWETVKRAELRHARNQIDKPYQDRVELGQHIAFYVMINVMLWMLFLSGSPFIAVNETGSMEILRFPWPLMVTFFWGIGLVADVTEKLNLRRNERAIEREMEAERRQLYGEKAKRDSYYDDDADYSIEEPLDVRLTGDGELTDSMIDEIKRQQRPKRR